MNGCTIPKTPIAVDFWKTRNCPNAKIFFLTHLHGDHTVGLTSSWQHDIYCSEITGKLLRLKYDIKPSLIQTLEIGSSTIVYLDRDRQAQMTVTAIDANHCPGAVMFLFEGYFGKILYTGDFRFHEQMREDPVLRKLDNLDILYLDNTYCSPRCVFPTRHEALQEILSIVIDNKDTDIVLGLRNLGKEDLLLKIAEETQEWISVPTDLYKTAEMLGLPDVLHTEEWDSRIRVVPFYSVSNKNIEKWNQTRPTIAILPTALYTGLDMLPFANQEKVFVVQYSDHSSFPELVEFVKMLKPKSVYPIVSKNSKGPFGARMDDRADMSCFLYYLSSENRAEFEIPYTVRRLMSTPTKVEPIGGKKRKRTTLKKQRSKTKKMGVTFEDSESDSCDDLNISEANISEARKGSADRSNKDLMLKSHVQNLIADESIISLNLAKDDNKADIINISDEENTIAKTDDESIISLNLAKDDNKADIINISDEENTIAKTDEGISSISLKDDSCILGNNTDTKSRKTVHVKNLDAYFTSELKSSPAKKSKINVKPIHPKERLRNRKPSVVPRTVKSLDTESENKTSDVTATCKGKFMFFKSVENRIHVPVNIKLCPKDLQENIKHRKVNVKPL